MEYQIGDFSKISRLSIKTLRYYHEIGILSPTRIDEESGYRYYDEECLERVRIIGELKSLEFSLTDIKDILKKYNEDSDIVSYMTDKLQEINRKVAEYQEIQIRLNTFINKEEKAVVDKNSDITIKELQDVLIASIRFTGKYTDVGSYISKLYKHCGRYAVGKQFSLYYDADYKEEEADIEICLPVSREISKEGIKSRVLPGGRAISIIHKGPYETLGSSYKVIIDYVNRYNIKSLLPSREIYIKGPGMIFKGNLKNYLTEIQICTE